MTTSATTNPIRWRDALFERVERLIPDEAAVALVHDASTTAVMMASPADLEDLAVGFSLTEGIIADAAEIRALEIIEAAGGIEARIWLAHQASAKHAGRRRALAGPTGCGLCGVESLAQALRPTPRVAGGLKVAAARVGEAMDSLRVHQTLWSATRAVHAAGLWTPGEALAIVREDVGRHNALDKAVGAWARTGTRTPPAAILLTSRVSVELVQKAAMAGAQMIIAVSAPTALAVRTADRAGITLAAIARSDGFEVFTHPGRIEA